MSEKQFRCRAEVEAGYVPEEVKVEEPKPLTFKEKITNYWYYYKWHTLIIGFIAIVLSYGLAQCVTKENPDYIVMTVFDKFMPSEVTLEIEAYLEQYAEDLNGDGKTVVHVYDASKGTDSDMQMAHSTRLMAEMQKGDVMLFFVDDTCFERLNDMNMFEKNELFVHKDGRALNLKDSDLTDRINNAKEGYINHDYYIAKRVVKGTDFEKVKRSVESEKQNLKLLEKFIEGLKPAEIK